MKLSCLQENFSRGLGIVGRTVATRSNLPITQNILLATEQSRLKLRHQPGNGHYMLDWR